MRFLTLNLYLLYLTFELSQGFRSEKQDEWTALLEWYRTLQESDGIYEDSSEDLIEGEEWNYFGEDEYSNGGDTVADAPNSRWSVLASTNKEDRESLWNNLVKGGNFVYPREVVAFDEDEKSIRGASLAFVFDSTGSMGDELNHVKSGAMKILAALRDHPDAPIYNYIWVPFNDPEIGPITVTRDPKLFEQRMSDVVATGGGDCPEMSLGAIRKALETSLPNSYIYVFTDAPPKDSNHLNDVLSLIQRKQAQVVFIVTDGCLETEKSQYWVYEQIAQTSSGQIYKMTTDEVKEVLKYVKVALQPHIVSLVSLNKPAPDKNHPDKVDVVVDDSLQQFTVSVSGINAKIDVSDPKGFQINGPPQLEKVLNLPNIKVVNVKKPDPGAWSVLIKSDSDYTIRSTGLSKFNFIHGFSTKETSNMKETNYRPLKGAKSFVLIQTSKTDDIFTITTLDFVSLTGNILESLQLDQVQGKTGMYKAGGFIPPNEFFYLGVSGFSRDGLPIKRISSTAISAQVPEKPIVTVKAKYVGRVNHPGEIGCRVESVVPVLVKWYRNGKDLKMDQKCSETCEVILRINKYTPDMEGKYHCQAQNIAGIDSKELLLTVIGKPPSVNVTSPIVTSLGQAVLLNCSVDSEFPYTVNWAQFTATDLHSGVFHPSSAGIKLKNNSLFISSVKAEDEGWYICIAKNKAGESQGRILLNIKEPVVVNVTPTEIIYKSGDSARIVCSASGRPKPRIEWLRNHQMIKDPSVVVEEIKENLNLVIDYLEQRHAGIYTCNAANPNETATASVTLIYKESPQVKAKENSLIVKDGSEAVMKCTATGVPDPDIKWFKGDRELHDKDERFEITKGTLIIKSLDASDFGEYSCVAENDQGTAVDHIGLTIGSEPTFLQKPRTREIQLNHSGTIFCSAFGVPLPEIKWTRLDGRELNKTRFSVLPTGALKITRMTYEDGGGYRCEAENVFGSISHEVTLKASGVVAPTPVDGTELTEVKAISGNELTIPCGIQLGNPPAKVKWFKDGVEIQEESGDFRIKGTGTLVILNATVQNEGNYLCHVVNVVGQASRSFGVSISEPPTIMVSNDTNLKGKIGGEVLIPCPVKGHPVPTIIWTKNGLPLPMSATIFQDNNGSLIIRNLSEDNSGLYVCTATNSIGSMSKETTIQVQVPPSFTDEVEDYPINVVEGHMVVLNCNASATPEPEVRWFKDDKPFTQDGSQSSILRFFATIDHTGRFKCLVTNEAGFDSREFDVTILVPPKILGRQNEKSIKAKTGIPITLTCNVTGTPTPTILWQRNGMYLTQNSSDAVIFEDGSLKILNVSKDSAGAYTCDAENLGGITQRTYYLQVNYPPRMISIRNNTEISLKEGDEYSLDCFVEGNPKPSVIWKKNGFPIDQNHPDMSVLEDNTLIFLQVNMDMTGTYRCEAMNSEGFVFKEHEITVLVPPSLASDFRPTKLEVNEGDSLSLTCPTILSVPPPNIQWIKDGRLLDPFFQERSDEAQMKLSPDQRTLTIVEAHPIDRGNYSCVATNPVGRTDARFFVDVLMTPHFEEFNHVAHRTILTGGEVVLNCSVSGNPQPKVVWRKENTSITPHNTPGVHVTLDKKHLKIVNGRVDHTGTYICLATNKVNTKEREFYVTVLEPPQMTGSLQNTIEVLKGGNVTLECPSSGSPPPVFTWIKKTDSKMILNVSEDTLNIFNAQCEDSGIYLCQVTNAAGTRTKYFDVSVLESPKIENEGVTETINGIIGGNITLKCKTSGNPRPETTWLHNGRILTRKKKSVRSARAVESLKDLISLQLTNLQIDDAGIYTLLAFNSAGVVEKNFQVQILAPPTLIPGHHDAMELITVPHSFSVVLKCPVKAQPTPLIVWLRGNDSKHKIHTRDNIVISGSELWIKETNFNNSGVYVCMAENPAGTLTHSFNVSVIESPKLLGNLIEVLDVYIDDTLNLFCNISGSEDVTYTWSHSLRQLHNDTNTFISPDGKTLIVKKVKSEHAGSYTCKAQNKVGFAEEHFLVKTNANEHLSDQPPETYTLTVHPHQSFTLNCLRMGDPPPRSVRWYKDGKKFEKNGDSLTFGEFYVKFGAARLEDAGDYKCIIGKGLGQKEMNFRVDVVVPGEWSQWSQWSPCSVSCGSGQQTRTRICGNERVYFEPNVKVDESYCEGDRIEKKICVKTCQESEWGEWTPCSASCSLGTRKRCKVFRDDSQTDMKKEDCEEEKCYGGNRSPDGHWSEWSEWSPCSRSGMMRRNRKCHSSSEEPNGKKCSGLATETKTCNGIKCSEPGNWLPWTEWSPCSRTCGKGHRKRVRKCEPSKCGRLCTGNNHQIQKCFLQYCSNKTFPSSASVQVKGNLNGKPIEDRINVQIDSSNERRQISTNLNSGIQKQNWFPYTPFLFSPISWNMAYETENTDNGFSLTDGNFRSESDIKFSTGEDLTVKHKGDGVNENGTILVEIEVIGEVPIVQPRAVVIIDPIEQDLIQTGPSNIYAYTQSDMTIDNRTYSYSWKNSIQYDANKGTMPYFVEKMTMRNITNTYDPTSKNVQYSVVSTIGKKSPQNKCPPGFTANFKYMHCEDIDECEKAESLCESDRICENTLGSYQCICKTGYKMTEGQCLDVNECSQNYDVCSHFCHNSPGSYICSCPYGYTLDKDRSNCIDIMDFTFHHSNTETPPSFPPISDYFDLNEDKYQEHKAFNLVSCPPGYFFKNNKCKDYNECENFRNICDADETCINLPGSFQCLSTPCPMGYDRIKSNGHCVKICSINNKCTRGAMVSESLIFYPASLNLTHILPLEKIGQPECNVVRTRYKVVESMKLFQVRKTEGRHFLYPIRKLNRNTLYRVEIEAFSYGPKNELLYFTKLIIFLIVS